MERLDSALDPIEAAILQTVAYVDMFDYPLTADEIHRYLVGKSASQSQVKRVLVNGGLVPNWLEQKDSYFFLPGRGKIVSIRRRRAAYAQKMWPLAVQYGQQIAALPFVRMVAVTGSLAVDNAELDADIDYLIVTATGRLWMCRALVIMLVKRAARQGVALCPNYFLSEQALVFDEENLYSAHELAQMVPISGKAVYQHMLDLNPWVNDYLPNAEGLPRRSPDNLQARSNRQRWLQRGMELGLRLPPGKVVEQWEMKRKIRKFTRQAAGDEAAFSADWCKGHFDSHRRHALEEFAHHWEEIEQLR